MELLERTGIVPIVLEKSEFMGGISRTVNYKGNRMDIGGHRFFSKSDRVMEWWVELMPPDVEDTGSDPHENQTEISYQGKKRVVAVPAHLHEEPVLRGAGPIDHHAAEETELEDEPDPEAAEILVTVAPHDPDLVMLIRPRKSRIYYLRKFFDYPITLTGTTLLGTNTVTGTAMLGNGFSGSLTVASNGIVNGLAGTSQGPLTVAAGAIVNWLAGTLQGPLTVAAGAMVNWLGGSIRPDRDDLSQMDLERRSVRPGSPAAAVDAFRPRL